MRRALGIGRTSSTDRRANEFERMSDAELVEALSRQANELGVKINLALVYIGQVCSDPDHLPKAEIEC